MPTPDLLLLLRQRASFRHWAHDVVRFSDTDMLGHVNNAAYSQYCETGRVAFNRAATQERLPATSGLLVARVAIDFRAETYYPSQIDIGTGVLAIGTSSFTLGQGLFVDTRLVATSDAVIVHVERATHRPAPLPEAVRAGLETWLLQPAG